MSLAAVSLDDKYALERGRIYLNGVQALVRLTRSPFDRLRRVRPKWSQSFAFALAPYTDKAGV